MLLDQVAEGVLAGDDRKQVEAGDELEVFEQAEVGGIGHGDGQRAAFPLEREDHALGGHVGGDQLDDLGIDLEPGEVDRRHAILAGEHLGDLELLDKPELHQHVAEPVLAVLLLRKRLRELLARDQAFAEEDFAEPITTGCCRRHDLVGLEGRVSGVISAGGAGNLSRTSAGNHRFLEAGQTAAGPKPGTRRAPRPWQTARAPHGTAEWLPAWAGPIPGSASNSLMAGGVEVQRGSRPAGAAGTPRRQLADARDTACEDLPPR